MNFESWLNKSLPDISEEVARKVLSYFDEGANIAFIAAYRNHELQGLTTEQIEHIAISREKWQQLEKRRAQILAEANANPNTTEEIKKLLTETTELSELEDHFLSLKPKKKTKAMLAKEAGLEELANWIWNCGHGIDTPKEGQTLEIWAYTFRNEAKGIDTAEAAINGASDIIVERLSENPELRKAVRKNITENGFILTQKTEKAKPNSRYERFFDSEESIAQMLLPENSFRYFTIRRGWIEEELSMKIGGEKADTHFESRLLELFEKEACTVPDFSGSALLKKAAFTALKTYTLPAIETETHRRLREISDEISVMRFSENLRNLLLSPPFGRKPVMGIDPSLKMGSKAAVIDSSGKLLGISVLNLANEEEQQKSKTLLLELIKLAPLEAIAVGNGHFGRETEIFVRKILKEASLTIPTIRINEAGSRAYATSEAAKQEFPSLDPAMRGAISIARRFQDPLLEIAKVDPWELEVGYTQHDVNQSLLKKILENSVSECLLKVGVDANTIPKEILRFIPGFDEAMMQAFLQMRTTNPFKSREDLKKVPGMTDKIFTFAAPYFRFAESTTPLDKTAIHPELYPAIEKLCTRLGKPVDTFFGNSVSQIEKETEVAQTLGESVWGDILDQFEMAGQDVRGKLEWQPFRNDIFKLEDVKIGFECTGIVTNVAKFGAFVDIGINQDGLVHLSQLSKQFVKDPRDVIKPGDRVNVRVIDISLSKKQLALSMKPQETRVRHVGKRRNIKAQERPKKQPKPKFTNNAFAAALSGLKIKK